ncbi:ceramide-1-phosphate transfer protein [Biomphalaria pfeifferi]|uniref:Ceramide-1-phosphate transfer protein n=1 Tax=Biomphalaria pfeifferi TaxID=112525 RepID=A0AAD8BWI2_BIOPF|nr:ceramide-1-phosphate transfer protein [Biomphalaria pfeifferi]
MVLFCGPVLLLLGATLLSLCDLGSSHVEVTSMPTLLIQESKESLQNASRTDKKAGKKKVRISVRLQLPASKVTKLFNGEDEGQYRRLTEILTEDIQKMYADQPGEQKVYELKFSAKRNPNETQEPESKHPKKNINSERHKGKKSGRRRQQKSIAGDQKRKPRRKARKSQRVSQDLMTPSEVSIPSLTKEPKTTKREIMAELVTTTELWGSGVAEGVKASDDKFNVPRLTNLFRQCLKLSTDNPNDYTIWMDQYLAAYNELLRIFYFFGPIFKFAADDVREKIDLLRSLRQNGDLLKNDNYTSIQSMFEYEFSPLGNASKQEGVSENKYLLRALKFIGLLIKHFRDPDTSRGMSSKAKEAYDESLAQYHEWYIRAAVNLALLAFPSRESALALMDVPDTEVGARQMDDLYLAVTAVYNEMLKVYLKYSATT